MSERKINEMLYPVFDIAAGLMPVLMEESEESFSSKSDPRSYKSEDKFVISDAVIVPNVELSKLEAAQTTRF